MITREEWKDVFTEHLMEQVKGLPKEVALFLFYAGDYDTEEDDPIECADSEAHYMAENTRTVE